MKTPRLLAACLALLPIAGLRSEAASPPKPAISDKAPYQEFILPVGQKAAHKAAVAVIKAMGFEFPLSGQQSFPASGDVDQWQRFQFNGMGRFTTKGPEEGTIFAVRVDEPRYASGPETMKTTRGRDAISSHFQADDHPGFYHANSLRADFTDEPNGGGTKIQVWITNVTLSANSLSGADFGAVTGQINIPVHDSFLYGLFITKLAKELKIPKPVGIAP